MEKVRYCRYFNECANTNLQAVFDRILYTALEYRMPQKDLSSTLYIVTDMEFDSCARGASLTNFEKAKALYRKHGYKLPRVVFWNVQSRHSQQPVKMNEQGVALVSCNLFILRRCWMSGASGAFLIPFMKEFPWVRVTSLELLEKRVTIINELAVGGFGQLQALREDIFDQPFPDNSFDVVTLLEIMDHIPDAEKAVTAAVRTAKRR